MGSWSKSVEKETWWLCNQNFQLTSCRVVPISSLPQAWWYYLHQTKLEPASSPTAWASWSTKTQHPVHHHTQLCCFISGRVHLESRSSDPLINTMRLGMSEHKEYILSAILAEMPCLNQDAQCGSLPIMAGYQRWILRREIATAMIYFLQFVLWLLWNLVILMNYA